MPRRNNSNASKKSSRGGGGKVSKKSGFVYLADEWNNDNCIFQDLVPMPIPMASRSRTIMIPSTEEFVEDLLWTSLAVGTLGIASGFWEWPMWMTVIKCCDILHDKIVGVKRKDYSVRYLVVDDPSQSIISMVVVSTLLRAMAKYNGESVSAIDGDDNESVVAPSWMAYAA
ncbi:MAG: hypothetical protein SGARI_007490, partial [Bacillariaceae sp.]